MRENIINFIRKKDYFLVKELGQGGCGKTVLLLDDSINKYFVCKKYSPNSELDKVKYYKNFLTEIKLLHLAYHPNIVRVFNYYLYPENTTGYILMEYIKGDSIDIYLRKNPENINEIFSQVIDGFSYLEENNILHRDIRPQNIMIADDGIVKIIDLGFGKKVSEFADFDKSVSLNWRYSPPEELSKGIYNYQTELYFIAKLFENIIAEEKIKHFKYKNILGEMLYIKYNKRETSFINIKVNISKDKFVQIGFTKSERTVYINFANSLFEIINKITDDTKYIFEIERIQPKLRDLYKSVMLENYIYHSPSLIDCFLDGGYVYKKAPCFRVNILKSFISLLESCSKEKKNIIINNLHLRLNAIGRYAINNEDNIPF